MTWFCYILRCLSDGHKELTYNGSTNNLIRRLRQHNGEISGGAKATRGKTWEIYAVLTGFETHENALSCEWRIKHPTNTKKRPKKYCGVKGRIAGLNEVLCQEKWTQKCTINNYDCNYTLYIAKDVIEELDCTLIFPNVCVKCVDTFDQEFVKSINL